MSKARWGVIGAGRNANTFARDIGLADAVASRSLFNDGRQGAESNSRSGQPATTS